MKELLITSAIIAMLALGACGDHLADPSPPGPDSLNDLHQTRQDSTARDNTGRVVHDSTGHHSAD